MLRNISSCILAYKDKKMLCRYTSRYICQYRRAGPQPLSRLPRSFPRLQHYFSTGKVLSDRSTKPPSDFDAGPPNQNNTHEKSSFELGSRNLLRGTSPFLTKIYQFLPESDQQSLQSFSQSIENRFAKGYHIYMLYKSLKRSGLNKYLSARAMLRVIKLIAIDRSFSTMCKEQQKAEIVLELMNDYPELGFTPGIEEYAKLIRSLAQDLGREKDALQLLDDLVSVSDIAPFLQSLLHRRGMGLASPDMIPSDEEIDRIEQLVLKQELKENSASETQNTSQKDEASSSQDDVEGQIISAMLKDGRSVESQEVLDQIQQLVIERRAQNNKSNSQTSPGRARKLPVSRSLYHDAMRGFAAVFHVRGVMEVLTRMLEASTQVPYRIARHLMPNKETWQIVSVVLLRQRDRTTFVKTWIDFLSRGARPPIFLTQSLVRILVSQHNIEQAVWVMRISRCLPDRGKNLPRSPHSIDHISWDLKVQIMHVAHALEAATSLDTTKVTHDDALKQGAAAAQLPLTEKPDPIIYAQLIGGAVRMKNDRLAEHLFRELIEADVAPQESTYGHIAELYAEKDKIARVFTIARDILVQNYIKRVKTMEQNGELETISSRVSLKNKVKSETFSMKFDVECIVPLLRFYIEEGRQKEAVILLRSWDSIYENNVPAEKLAHMMVEIYNDPESSASIETTVKNILKDFRTQKASEEEQSTEPDSQSVEAATGTDIGSILRVYSGMLSTHIRAKNMPAIIRALRDLAEYKIEPPYSILDKVMQAFLREHMLDLFDTVHAYLRETKHVPLSLPMYSRWMRTLLHHGDIAGVQAAFDELLEMGQLPTQQHYLYLIQAYAYGGWIDRAVGIVNTLRNPKSIVRAGMNINIALIEAHVASGNLEEAWAELRYLLTNSTVPINRIPARPFNYLIIGNLFYGQGRRAMDMYEAMIRAGIKPDVYTFAILIHSYALAKDLPNCTRVFNEMIRVGIAPDVVIYTILICAFGVARKVSSAELVFNQVAQEQDWSREQRDSSSEMTHKTGHSISEILELYTKDPDREDWPELLDTMDTNNISKMEKMRAKSFYNLDPIVYIAMLKVYNRSNRPLRAIVTWERFIKNYPIVRWNPRKGGIESKTLSFTGDFHLPAWSLLLRTTKESTGARRVLQDKLLLSRYLSIPQTTEQIKAARMRRAVHSPYLLPGFDINTADKATVEYNDRLTRRSKILEMFRAELDRRVVIDHKFIIQVRKTAPLPGTLESLQDSIDPRYWIPEDTPESLISQLSEAADKKAASKKPKIDYSKDKASMLGEDGEFVHPTACDIASLVARKWRDLEDMGFKFSNRHVADYIPSILVGRQYDELIRFLSLVKPYSEDKPSKEDDAEDDASNSSEDKVTDANDDESNDSGKYRYINMDINIKTTLLLCHQINTIYKFLMMSRNRRVLLDIMANQSKNPLFSRYREVTKFSIKSLDRNNEDELQVLKEYLVYYAEVESVWVEELKKLRQVAELWKGLVDSTGQARIESVLYRVQFALES